MAENIDGSDIFSLVGRNSSSNPVSSEIVEVEVTPGINSDGKLIIPKDEAKRAIYEAENIRSANEALKKEFGNGSVISHIFSPEALQDLGQTSSSVNPDTAEKVAVVKINDEGKSELTYMPEKQVLDTGVVIANAGSKTEDGKSDKGVEGTSPISELSPIERVLRFLGNKR